MAKSDPFFIRADLASGDGSFSQTSIDMGPFVDALGKSVVKVHSVSVSYTNNTDLGSALTPNPDTQAYVAWQLTTQSQSTLVRPSNKAVIASGSLSGARGAGLGDIYHMSHDMDVAPQHWSGGYLVGVEALYIGAENNNNWGVTPNVSVILECTVESLTQSAAMALALSQQ